MNQKKIANLGLFAAVAIIFGYVESLIPFFAGIPGMKLGLANLAVLFILEKYTWKEAALVSAVRIVVIGFMFGNLFSILYSLAGAALSLTVMTLMKKKSGFSILGISVAGGVSHNIGQLIIASHKFLSSQSNYGIFSCILFNRIYRVGIFHQFEAFFHPVCQIDILVFIHKHRICIIFLQQLHCIIHSKNEACGGEPVCQEPIVADDRHGI